MKWDGVKQNEKEWDRLRLMDWNGKEQIKLNGMKQNETD